MASEMLSKGESDSWDACAMDGWYLSWTEVLLETPIHLYQLILPFTHITLEIETIAAQIPIMPHSAACVVTIAAASIPTSQNTPP